MLGNTPLASEEIYLLADHLDAALAAGEDLIATTAVPAEGEDEAEAIRRFVGRLRVLEAALVSRILQARKRAQDVRRVDGDTRSLLSLYVANSAGVLDLIEKYGRRPRELFETGDDPMSFLRSRGLIAEDAAMPESLEKLQVGDAYRLGGVAELGPLLDLVSTMLETLDIRYDLYAEDMPDPVLPLPSALSLEDVVMLARAASADVQHVEATDVAAALIDVREEANANQADVEISVTVEAGEGVVNADGEASTVGDATVSAVAVTEDVAEAADMTKSEDQANDTKADAGAPTDRAHAESVPTASEADSANEIADEAAVTPKSLLAALEAMSGASEKRDSPVNSI